MIANKYNIVDRRQVKKITINNKYDIYTDTWTAYNTVGDGLKQGLESETDLPPYIFAIIDCLRGSSHGKRSEGAKC